MGTFPEGMPEELKQNLHYLSSPEAKASVAPVQRDERLLSDERWNEIKNYAIPRAGMYAGSMLMDLLADHDAQAEQLQVLTNERDAARAALSALFEYTTGVMLSYVPTDVLLGDEWVAIDNQARAALATDGEPTT
jgi:hypothetical protein